MCAQLLACPLCSQPGFLTLDALRAGLISVATRPLICPVCNEVLLGIDKLTIHLFSHTINLSNNALETSKQLSPVIAINNVVAAQNLHGTTFQEWNTTKALPAETCKIANNSTMTVQDLRETSKGSQVDKDKAVIQNPEVCIQDQNMTVKNVSQIVFLTDQACESGSVNVFEQCSDNERIIIESCKPSQEILPEAVKVNCNIQYSSDNTKHMNMPLSHNQVEQKSTQSFKGWMPDEPPEQHSSINNIIRTDINKVHTAVTKPVEHYSTLQNSGEADKAILTQQETKFANFELFAHAPTTCSNTSLERFNNEKNAKDKLPNNNTDIQNEASKQQDILPQLKAFQVLATKDKTERCNICGFHFPDYNILLLHKQLVHMMNDKDLNGIPEELFKNYSCHLCSKVFKMRGSLMVHMRVAHTGYNIGSLPKDGQVELVFNEDGYNCPTCGKKFKKEQHVIQHLKTHEGKQWECDVCGKMFTTKYFLKKHKRLHSGEMPYKCNICNKTFTFQQSYHKHRLYHKDDKPHTCATCGRSFKELSTLHNHERIHTGEKPFACETCGKCFRQRVSYLVHRRIHTGVMPYKCTMCDKSFRYKVSQRTHKCPMQQTGNIQQSTDSDKKLLQSSDTQSTSNELCTMQKLNLPQDNQPMLQVIDNEKNKYILIINTQGQHLLAREADIGSTQTPTIKQQSIEYRKVGSEIQEVKNTWSSNIPNNPGFTRKQDTSSEMHIENKKMEQGENDFFSMVMSPLENGLPSPTTEMEHLHVSSPKQKENILESYNFKHRPNSIEMNLENSNIQQSFNNSNDDTNPLQTINEESLKQLLYGIHEK